MSVQKDRLDPSHPGQPEAADSAADGAADARSGPQRALPRLLGVVLLALLGLYGARVAGLLVTLQRAAIAEAGLSDEVDALRNEVTGLETAAADAQSDGFVERWAREERTMSRAGDRTILVVETEPETEVPAAPNEGLLRRLRRLFGRQDAQPAPPPAIESDAPPASQNQSAPITPLP
jgi:cell division protein FtsB